MHANFHNVVRAAWVMAMSVLALWVQAQNDFARDTSRVHALLQKAEVHQALYQWDSTATGAKEALDIVKDLLDRVDASPSTERHRALVALKANALGQWGRVLDEDQAKAPLTEALELFRSIADGHGEARVHLYFAEVAFNEAHYADAIRSTQKAILIYENADDRLEAAKAMNLNGEQYRIMGDPPTALELHLQALPVVTRLGTESDIAWNHILIGAVYRATQDWKKALEHFRQARAHYELSDDSVGIAISYNDLGTAYYGKADLDSSLYWHSRAAEVRERIGSLDGLGHSCQYIAQILTRRNHHDEAIAYYRRAIASFHRAGFDNAAARAHGNISDLYVALGDRRAAMQEVTIALDLMAKVGERSQTPELHYKLGALHAADGRSDLAVEDYRNGIAAAQRLDDLTAVYTGSQRLYRLYADLGDHRNGYLEHRRFLQVRDSSRVRADRSRVVQVMMKHDLEQERIRARTQDELDKVELASELDAQQRQKFVYIAGGSLFGSLALGLVMRLRRTARDRRVMEAQRLALRRAKDRAEQSEKFKERFLANMSHEIRTPMNAVMGMTTILRRNAHLPAQEEQLDAVAHNADQLLRILNDILDVSKLDAGRLDLEHLPFDVRSVVDQAIGTIADAATRRSIRLGAVVHDNVPISVVGDPTRVRQIIANLLDNAVKFTEHGDVVVQVGSEARAEGTVLLRFSVTDNGPGIPKDRQAGIFDEFTKAYSTGAHRHGGTGLGLTLSKRLTELQGGTISVHSEEGKGSTFIVDIPFAVAPRKDEAFASSGRVPTAGEEPLTDLRILLADDNAFNVMVAQDELSDAIPGVRVDVAVNGKEVIGLARVNEYDVILMDVQMPEMNGYDAARTIRSWSGAKAQVPILAMTANVLRSEMDRCMEAGMNGFVPKPFERKDLLEKLRSVTTSRRT